MRKKLLLLLLVLMLTAAAAAAGIGGYLLHHRTPGQFFDSAGVPIYYTVEGQGEPVILLHGLAVNADINWRRPGIVAALAEDFQVITMDARGHGLSGKPYDSDAYAQNMADDVIRLMDHMGLEKAHVVGYSMGGFTALNLLARYPDRLLSAAPCASGWTTPLETIVALTELADYLEQGRGFRPLLRRVGTGSRLNRWGTNRLLRLINDQRAIAAVARSLPELGVEESALRENAVPMLCIIGSLDPLKPDVDSLSAIAANCEAVIIEGADHVSMMWRPEFPVTLKSWLARQSSAHSAP